MHVDAAVKVQTRAEAGNGGPNVQTLLLSTPDSAKMGACMYQLATQVSHEVIIYWQGRPQQPDMDVDGEREFLMKRQTVRWSTVLATCTYRTLKKGGALRIVLLEMEIGIIFCRGMPLWEAPQHRPDSASCTNSIFKLAVRFPIAVLSHGPLQWSSPMGNIDVAGEFISFDPINPTSTGTDQYDWHRISRKPTVLRRGSHIMNLRHADDYRSWWRK